MFSPFTISAVESKDTVILGGEPFGIKMFCDGVMVVDTESFRTTDGYVCPAKEAGVLVNDVILTADGEKIDSNEELNAIIRNSNGEEIELEVKRNDKKIIVNLYPLKSIDNEYKAGMWIKDSTAGIGTITFYSTDNNGFCGLGHGICDTKTNGLMPLLKGDVDKAYVASVTKSIDGKVGSLNGYFTDNEIGIATLNCNEGIYGILDKSVDGYEIEIADSDEITLGEAEIITTINGSTPQEYMALITRIDRTSNTMNMVIQITDERLLYATGGIVQGMSGSPIVQNGKLIGAVTHVLIDDVDCGWAIFAENMMSRLEENCR